MRFRNAPSRDSTSRDLSRSISLASPPRGLRINLLNAAIRSLSRPTAATKGGTTFRSLTGIALHLFSRVKIRQITAFTLPREVSPVNASLQQLQQRSDKLFGLFRP